MNLCPVALSELCPLLAASNKANVGTMDLTSEVHFKVHEHRALFCSVLWCAWHTVFTQTSTEGINEMLAPIPKLSTLGKIYSGGWILLAWIQTRTEFRGRSCWKVITLMRTSSPVLDSLPSEDSLPVESQYFIFPNQLPNSRCSCLPSSEFQP